MQRERFPTTWEALGRGPSTPTDGILAEQAGRGWAALELKSFGPAQVRQTPAWLYHRSLDNAHFSFRDQWQVAGRIEEVAETLLNTEAVSGWWPQLAGVTVSGAGHTDGVERRFAARASGFLPYELAIDFRVVRVKFPEEFRVELEGDLYGHGGGRLRQNGPKVAIDFDLTIRVARPLLHVLSIVARPVLCAQHRWVMQQGELGLRKSIESRQRLGADL